VKLKAWLLVAGLACAATAASAKTTLISETDWGTHTAVEAGFDNFQTFQSKDWFYDYYSFSLASTASLDVVAFALDFGKGRNLKNAEFELFSGTQGSGTLVGSFALAGLGPITQNFNDLSSGNYYYEVTGQVGGKHGGTYAFTSSLEPVPEPSTTALLLAGVGLMVLTARRRGTKS